MTLLNGSSCSVVSSVIPACATEAVNLGHKGIKFFLLSDAEVAIHYPAPTRYRCGYSFSSRLIVPVEVARVEEVGQLEKVGLSGRGKLWMRWSVGLWR
jgi:hypothetical protein